MTYAHQVPYENEFLYVTWSTIRCPGSTGVHCSAVYDSGKTGHNLSVSQEEIAARTGIHPTHTGPHG